MNGSAIGVFDSGLGGLTCVKQLMSRLPNENIIYFGDTARVPYGNRSVKTITRYASQAIDFLLSKNVKLLIDACGTMSSSLERDYTESLPVPYINVINPAAAAAVKLSENMRIGVIATAATIKSGAFERSIREIAPTVEIFSGSCPLFVPLVENGHVSPDDRLTRLAAEEYLNDFRNNGIDTLILGCTHYPIISEIISTVMGKKVNLIDSGAEAAKYAISLLEKGDKQKGSLRVYISDNTIGFLDVASSFLGFVPDDVITIDLETLENGSNK